MLVDKFIYLIKDDFISDITELNEILFNGIALQVSFNADRYNNNLFEQYDIDFPAKLSNAVNKRKSEFLVGRVLAKCALEQLTGVFQPIHIGVNREPLWPSGVVGSISHTSNTAVCLLSTDIRLYIGVDIENILSHVSANNIYSRIICLEEKKLLAAVQENFSMLLTVVFSAKESLFKALFPKVDHYFDFNAVRVFHLDIIHGYVYLQLTENLCQEFQLGDVFLVKYFVKRTKILSYLIGNSAL